jgi:hypothetical protein
MGRRWVLHQPIARVETGGRQDEVERAVVTLGKCVRDGQAVAMTACGRSARSFVTDVSEAGLQFATPTALLIRLKRIRNVSFGSARTEALQLWLISKEKSFGPAGSQ